MGKVEDFKALSPEIQKAILFLRRKKAKKLILDWADATVRDNSVTANQNFRDLEKSGFFDKRINMGKPDNPGWVGLIMAKIFYRRLIS